MRKSRNPKLTLRIRPKSTKPLRLQPLRITAGWRIDYHIFFDVPLTRSNVEEGIQKQNLFQAVHEGHGILLDLGFTPEGDFKRGAYRLVVYRGDFTGKLLYKFSSREKRRIVAEMERVFAAVTSGNLSLT